MITRISATPAASELIAKIEARSGKLMFHQSGGCCDGSAPMCFELGDFKVGSRDVYMGDLNGHPFFMSESQFEYWQHTHLTIDVTEGRGASFSLEIPYGLRFIVRSRLFTMDEINQLKPTITGEQWRELHEV